MSRIFPLVGCCGFGSSVSLVSSSWAPSEDDTPAFPFFFRESGSIAASLTCGLCDTVDAFSETSLAKETSWICDCTVPCFWVESATLAISGDFGMPVKVSIGLISVHPDTHFAFDLVELINIHTEDHSCSGHNFLRVEISALRLSYRVFDRNEPCKKVLSLIFE